MADDVGARFTTFHFSQANPAGPEPDRIPALLRRVADTIEGLGDVAVHDVVMNPPYDPEEDGPRRSITVFYGDKVAEDEHDLPDTGE